MTHEEAKKQLERVLAQRRLGLTTKKERNDAVLAILYAVLYPEQL